MHDARNEKCGYNGGISSKCGPTRDAHDVMDQERRMAGKCFAQEFVPEYPGADRRAKEI
jgi:hypothetical protein